MQVVAATEASIQQSLKRWNKLVKRKAQLEERIPRQEERIARLEDALSADGILSGIVQRYENMVLGVPRASTVDDRMAEQVTSIKVALEHAKLRLSAMRVEYAEVCAELEEIEDAVAGLDPRYQRLLMMYYRDRLHWRDICDELYISKARMYQMINAAIRMMDWGR